MCELEPRVEARELPPDITELREEVAAAHARLDALRQPLIDAHVAALAAEVDRVIEVHRRTPILNSALKRAGQRSGS